MESYITAGLVLLRHLVYVNIVSYECWYASETLATDATVVYCYTIAHSCYKSTTAYKWRFN